VIAKDLFFQRYQITKGIVITNIQIKAINEEIHPFTLNFKNKSRKAVKKIAVTAIGIITAAATCPFLVELKYILQSSSVAHNILLMSPLQQLL
jgi:RAB protein geranylgeranyltransferase component A